MGKYDNADRYIITNPGYPYIRSAVPNRDLIQDTSYKSKAQTQTVAETDAYTSAEIENESATASYNEAKRERQLFNSIIGLGFMLAGATVAGTVLFTAWFLFLSVASIVAIGGGVSFRMHDELRETRDREIRARHVMGSMFTERLNQQMQLIPGSKD